MDDILACPVCLEVPGSKILQCKSGHHICHFCHKKLAVCPLCKAEIVEVRLFVLENIIQHLKDMKISLDDVVTQMEVDICKYRKIIEKKSEDAFTQTNFTLPEISSYTQTDESSHTSLVQLHKKKQTVDIISYPCLIDSCKSQLSYAQLIVHLKKYHENIFHEVEPAGGILSTTFVISTTLLPATYKFAVFTSDMGLFFYNAVIYSNGKLIVNVQYVHDMSKILFDYELVLKGKNDHLRRYAMVTSYRIRKEKLSLYSLHVHETEMSEILRDDSFECILTIKQRNKYSNSRPKIKET
ncbi:E3 ubiquitin-protein ligase Siah1 [Anthophora plagiata]